MKHRPGLPDIFVVLNAREVSAIDVLVKIVDWLRPDSASDTDSVIARITELEKVLTENPEADTTLASILQDWLCRANYYLAFAVLGLFSRQGFFQELGKHLYERINPMPLNEESLADALSLIFHKNSDPEWVFALPDVSWLRLFGILWNAESGRAARLLGKTISEMLYAMEMLSIWVASEELEPDLVRLDPRIVARDSAFQQAYRHQTVPGTGGCQSATPQRALPDPEQYQIAISQHYRKHQRPWRTLYYSRPIGVFRDAVQGLS